MNKLIYLAVGIFLAWGMPSANANTDTSPSPDKEETGASNLFFVETGDSKVAYRVDGQGSGLVLIPGTGGNAESNWGHLVGYFSPHWTVVRPEYSGAGQTVDDGSPLTIEKVAAQVVAAAEAANAVPFDVIGYSLGGSIAAYIAAEYPDKVRSVILLTGFATADSRARLQFSLWKDLISSDLQAIAKLVMIGGLSPDYLSSMTDAQIAELQQLIVTINDWSGMLRQIDLNLSLDIRNQIPRIQKPTLVIGCTHDQILPPTQVRALADTIQGARYTELSSGHLVIVERPAEFAQLALQFLGKDQPQ